MLKNLKEEGFCTNVLLAQKQLSEDFSCKDKLCSFCELPAWWKTSQTPLLTKIRDFESTETSKIWNLRSQILLSLWAPRIVKIYSKTSFDKIEGFWTLCSFKNLKMQTFSFFHTPPWWKLLKFIFWQKSGLEQSGSWENEVNLFQSHFWTKIVKPCSSNWCRPYWKTHSMLLTGRPLRSQACPSKFS